MEEHLEVLGGRGLLGAGRLGDLPDRLLAPGQHGEDPHARRVPEGPRPHRDLCDLFV